MNIALFTDTYPPFINGVSTSCYNLAQTLKAHGHQVTVVTTRSSNGKLECIDDVIYMPGIEMKKLYGYRLTKLYDKKVESLLKEKHIDIIHNQTDSTVGIFARRMSKRLNIPIVYTYHTNYEDYTYYFTKGVFDRVVKKAMRTYSRSVVKGATEFITPSDKTKDFMRSIGNDDYINVIPTGIDFSIFDKTNMDQQKIDEFKVTHGIGKNTKVLLLLGRVAKEKSMDVSITYFAAYLKKHPDANIKMLVVGDGPAKHSLELLTHELGISPYVEFLGPKKAEEVPFYYHLADIYNSASITETQGLTFMEAMASSAIVLARFDDNLIDTIIDGETGFFFTDEAGFISKLEKILSLKEEESNKLASQALEIVDKYSIEKFYQNVMKVYQRAIKKFW